MRGLARSHLSARPAAFVGVALVAGVALVLLVVLSPSAAARPVARLDCAKLPCTSVLPGARTFVPAPGGAPYMLGQDASGQLLGWVALSTDVVDIKGYSGKPLVTLIGVTRAGKIGGARVVHHSEPILLVGIPESALHAFVAFYRDKALTTKIAVGASPDRGAVTVDVISGATVTVLAENRTILDTARAVGEATGVLGVTARVPGHFVEQQRAWSWQQLLASGVLGRLTISGKQMGEASAEPFIDLFFTLADAPQIGRALLGVHEYDYQRKQLAPGEHFLVVLSNGTSSFKGSGFVRGGIFDRVRVEQGLRSLMFTDRDYRNLTSVAAVGAPRFKEGALFIARAGKLDPGRTFDLVFLGSRYNRKGGFSRDFHAFRAQLRLPRSVYALDGPDPEGSLLRAAWYNARWRLLVLLAFLAVLTTLFASRRFLTARQARLRRLHVGVLLASLFVLGFGLRAQPSITQVLTVAGSLQHGWRWELFLSEPLIFVFWIYVLLVTVSWGRGVFCGWACPYGALSELAFKLGRLLRLPLLELPDGVHLRLRYLRYVVLVVLVGVFIFSPQLGEVLAEIEPFKTTFFVAPWTRGLLFIGWWLLLLLWGLLAFRPFCRYLCPLGAALALPGSLRFSGPRRRNFCASCQICTRTCEPRAIRPNGTIDPRECLSCMECEANFRDVAVCPPLVGLARLAEKRAAGALEPKDEERERRLEEGARPW